MLFSPYKAVSDFESCISFYTGAPYVVAIDSCTSALFLSLLYKKVKNQTISIPKHTYPSVPNVIIHSGARVKFTESDEVLIGAYELGDTGVWDSALNFTADMYKPNSLMCLSFSGPYKHLKLTKGGAILTDDIEAYKWLKRSRYNGRNECSYMDDNFDMLGWNFYMTPELGSRGLLLMSEFVGEGYKKHNPPLQRKYPDLSKFEIFKQ
jgi:dTDP-4-amino-4,6-dideoxygalactose transaminase